MSDLVRDLARACLCDDLPMCLTCRSRHALEAAEARVKWLEGVVLEVEMSRDADTARRHAEGVAEGEAHRRNLSLALVIAQELLAEKGIIPSDAACETAERHIAVRVVGALPASVVVRLLRAAGYAEREDDAFADTTAARVRAALQRAILEGV